MNNEPLNSIREQITKDQSFRIKITQENFMWFFVSYFGDYIDYQIADVHKKMFELAEDLECSMKVIT